MKRRNKEMFSCLGLEGLAPLDMMDELRVHRDKSWTDGSEMHQSQHSLRGPHAGIRETSSGERVNCSAISRGSQKRLRIVSSTGGSNIYTSSDVYMIVF